MCDNVIKRKEEISIYFSKTKDQFENAMYQFFKNEINPHDIKIAHTDVSVVGNSRKERKYVCALWNLENLHKTKPWIRIGIPIEENLPLLEVVLPVFHGDMPNPWSEGKTYFRLGMAYTIGKNGSTLQFVTNQISLKDTTELLSVISTFTRKIKSYEKLSLDFLKPAH